MAPVCWGRERWVHLICCVAEGRLVTRADRLPSCPSVRKPSSNVHFSHPRCVDHWGESGKPGGGEKKQRVSGAAGAPTSGRGLVWVDPDEAGLHPQHVRPHLLLPVPWRLLLQPSAAAWVGKPLCAMKSPLKTLVEEMEEGVQVRDACY